MKIGLYFGSFNPIHIGHLITANTIAELAQIDQVWFVVSPHNPHKQKSSLLHEFDRYDLVRLAIGYNPKLEVSDIEFHLPKPSYTIDTLTHIQEKYPNYKFSVVIGEDNLTHFHKWKNHDKLLEYYQLLVYPREGTPKTVFHQHPSVQFVDAPMLNISATYIRELIQQHKSIQYLVPDDVALKIKEKKFYL